METALRILWSFVTLLVVHFGQEATCSDVLCHPSCSCLDTLFDCRKQKLTEFPSDFPNWIEKLNISNNGIKSIDVNRLSRLSKLESLSLDGNNLTNIPNGGPVGLEDLIYLSLSRNMITSIEASQLNPLKSLLELDLSRNQIEFLSNHSFPNNFSLHVLNLGWNQLEQIPPGSLDPLIFLQELILQKNKIKTLSKDLFSQLENLERLDLSRNKLEMMDSLRFQELKKLQILNLRRNHMSNLSDAAFYGLDKIQHLYLDWNNIKVVEKRWLYGLRSLKTLNLSRNELSRIEDDSWEYMEELQTLELSSNKLSGISRKTLVGLSKLKNLDLSFNQIVSVDEDSFVALEKLETLDLSNNELSWALEDMASPFKGLSDCHTLNLASNRIKSLHPQALAGLSSLKTLNLSSNPLTWLSQKPFQDAPLLSINLVLTNIHSLVCDCESSWLQSKFTSIVANPTATREKSGRSRHRERDGSTTSGRPPKKIPSTAYASRSAPTCAYPPNLAGKNLLDVPLHNLTCSDNSPRPVFLLEPKTQIFLMEGNGSLGCHVESYSSPPPTVLWQKDHQDLPTHLESQVRNLERRLDNGSFQINSTLHLVNVSWADAGRYQCVAQNELGIAYSVKANVTVHIFPSFVKKPSNVTVRLGSGAKLECAAKGFPIPEIAFQKDGGEDFPAALDRRFHVMPNDDSFFIMEVKLTDMGVYCCSARNAAGEVKAYATVTVYETPSFSEPMEDETAVEGSNAILECKASGSPKPQISWNKDGILISDSKENRYHFTNNGSLLYIKDVQQDNAGRYECILSNAVGTARGFSSLSVVPNASAKTLNMDTSAMTIIFIIIAVFCVVATSAAWVVVIYRTRKRKKSNHPSESGVGHRHSLPKYEDLEDNLPSYSATIPPLVPYQLAKVQCGDSGSQSSSGKDSGTGDDLPPDADPMGIPDPEEEALMRQPQRRKKEMESFSTFGTRASASRLSQARLDLKSDICDVISLAHAPGREFLSMPRRVAMPVPPSHVIVQLPHRETLEVAETRSGCPSSSSSSGYSSLGVRTPAKRPKERTHSVTSEETESLNGALADSSSDGLNNEAPPSGANFRTLSVSVHSLKDAQSTSISTPV